MGATTLLLIKLTQDQVPWRDPKLGEVLTLTLYSHPPDHPDHYVLRASFIKALPAEGPGECATPVLLFRTLSEAESFVSSAFPDMTWIGSGLTGNPLVLGCWL